MPNPTSTIFVPYHALDEAIDDPTIARTNQSNTFDGDQTIDGDLIVTGEINPTRLAEQMPKVRALEGRVGVGETAGSRTLMSHSLASGMSLRHDEDAGLGYVTVGNFDTQLYQPLLLQAESVQVSTGISPLIAEHLRVHPSGGVTVGDGADHATDPGPGVLHARGLGTTPLNTASLTPVPAARVLGRGSAAGGPPEPLLIGAGLIIDGTVLRTVPRRSLAGRYDYATVLTPPPLNGQVRMNALFPYTAVTQVYVSYQTRDNEDMYWTWPNLPIGTRLILQNQIDHTRVLELRTTAVPVDAGGSFTIGVAYSAAGPAALANNIMLWTEASGLLT